MSNRLVENILKGIAVELFCCFWQSSNNFSNKWFALICLDYSELLRCAFADLEKCITSHFHDTWELFLHELKQLFDYSFQKGPIISQKGRILANNIHDAGGNNRFILFSLLNVT
jgi:hypothetical protein